jgi:hypothetical protein
VAEAAEGARVNESDRRSLRVVACLLAGRVAAALGLLVCLLHLLFGRPPLLWRAAAGTAVGVALLAEAASLMDDHRLFADELVRAVGLAALFVCGAVGRVWLARAPRRVDAREGSAALACAAGFAGAALWLRRRSRPAPERGEDVEDLYGKA